ncbi:MULTISPECIES: NCS2 family permease [Methanobrevibacter]|uniref:AGZA family xanthine/uracil permease-like MFS transporter n=1 Tax=Methanobrevibacter gottschalkii DSM 11977 TaxID=1122229 RepID=A0A3N5B0X9_9EURY|nr:MULTISPECIES: NCS2 family permease [Methanobrevibacter]OED01717.1 transporter permease [Methanobrevibacter sp. A27]RPF50994.1 AGZA family xanthine/uracil permease-like MFS transporter [Methanobrevibacter gottschalkii DSM 11977]
MLNEFFKLSENNTDVKTEVIAGLTTFLAMSYILGVNPGMLAEGGMPATGVFFATALASGIACIIMGLVSKYPVGLAPGMGMNALFTYTIILGMGNTWEAALAAVFISSIIFLLITVSGLREAILNAIPHNLKLAIGAGIGFFLAFIGLKGAGIIVADPSTMVTLGSLFSAPALLALIGIAVTLILYVRKVPAAVFIGLVITAILGIIFTAAGFGVGDIAMPSVPTEFVSTTIDTSVFGAFASGFSQLFTNIPNLILILFSLLFVTFFDTTGTLIPLANQCGFIDEEGNADGIDKAFLGDAIGGIIGAILGTSTLTAYVESATGIGLGGRTGLTAIVTGILFLISIIFAPTVLALFTSSVTAAALVIVGILMMIQLKDVDWDDLVVVASVFMTIIMMLLTYSISLGIAFGFVTYAITSIAAGKAKELNWLVWIMVLVFIIYLFFGL